MGRTPKVGQSVWAAQEPVGRPRPLASCSRRCWRAAGSRPAPSTDRATSTPRTRDQPDRSRRPRGDDLPPGHRSAYDDSRPTGPPETLCEGKSSRPSSNISAQLCLFERRGSGFQRQAGLESSTGIRTMRHWARRCGCSQKAIRAIAVAVWTEVAPVECCLGEHVRHANR